MAIIDLLTVEETDMTCDLRGVKIFIYGNNDTGKTFQSMRFPKPLLLMAEAGGSAIKGNKVLIGTWSEFTNYVKQLTDTKKLKDMQEKYQTIIIDTTSALVGLAEDFVCKEFNVRDLSEITGKQNGYKIYRKDFEQKINLLCGQGYTVIFIDHEEMTDKIDEITGEECKYFIPKGSNNEKGSTRFVRDLCDFTLYLKKNPVNSDTGEVVYSTAICRETKHCFARTRYTHMPTFVNPFTAENITKNILEAMEKEASDQGARAVAFTFTDNTFTAEDYKELIKPYMIKLIKPFPQEVENIITSQLAEGQKISDCSEEQKVELETIYTRLVNLANERGIVVD